MADPDADPDPLAEECREPTLEDLAEVCRHLNEAGAKYVVVGGFAIRAAGLVRQTMDIDLLVETGVENEQKVIEALRFLPDKAIDEVVAGEVGEHIVVRVADEIMIDLMKSGCGVDYAAAAKDMCVHEVLGVPVPFASPQTLWRMKQTVRDKDVPDRLYLRQKLASMGTPVEDQPAAPPGPLDRLRRWLIRLLGEK
jgi:hypothetical protein